MSNDKMYNRLSNEKLDHGKAENSYLSPAPISGSYRSTSLQDEPVPRCYIPWCGLVFYVLAFFGFFSVELIQEGLSVAIVAMVNHTAFADADVVMSNVTADQCPRDPELVLGDGEFNWDRTQQGIALAAYFYAHGLTEVLYRAFTTKMFTVNGPRASPPMLSCHLTKVAEIFTAGTNPISLLVLLLLLLLLDDAVQN